MSPVHDIAAALFVAIALIIAAGVAIEIVHAFRARRSRRARQ
jgi:ABC-type taurine transport system ATPase subunit